MYELSTSEDIKNAESKAISAVVRQQQERSIRPITDGEFARHIFYGGFFEKLEGFNAVPDLPIPDAFRTDFPTTTGLARMGAKTRAAVVCTGKIHYRESPYLNEWETLRNLVPEHQWKDCKITMPAPSYQHIQLKPGTAFTKDSGYSSDEQYFDDLAKAYAAEFKTLYNAGLRSIQVDDPNMTYFCSEQFLNGCKKDGVDTDKLLDLYIHAHNMALRGRPKDLHIGVHLCRGNMSGSTHWVTGSYERIAEKLFQNTDYDTFYLEFDDVQGAGGFDPLRFLPKGKSVVLGLISTKKAELEDKSVAKDGVRQAARVIAKAQGVSEEEAMDSLALSPQCGFSSSSLAGGKDMTEQRMWEKLELVRDLAKEIWSDSP